MRQSAKPRRRHDWGRVVALVALGAGVLWIVQTSGLGLSQQLFWPVAFACAGAALVWRQADRAEQKKWRAEAGGRVWLAPFVARGGWPALVRVIVGLGLVGAAFGLVVAQQGQLAQLPEVLAMTVLALAGWPWCSRPGCTAPGPRSTRPAPRRCGPTPAPTWPPTCTTRCCRPWR